MTDSLRALWVDPTAEGPGTGTFSNPFTRITEALEGIVPGTSIILRDGQYVEDVTVQISGSLREPITIMAENPHGAVFTGTSWYLYDASDFVIQGIYFKKAQAQAISVVGACERNAITNCIFENCSVESSSGCTVFFGGSGLRNNIVSDCRFVQRVAPVAGSELPIAIMITEGDTDEDAMPNRNHIFRGNHISGYGCGMVVGTRGDAGGDYAHVIESNTIEHCTADGIRLRCSDTAIAANLLVRCQQAGVRLSDSTGSVIEGNRFESCGTAIVNGAIATTIAANCLIDFSIYGIDVKQSAVGTIIEINTFVTHCDAPAVVAEDFTVIRGNLFSTHVAPVVARGAGETSQVIENATSENYAGGGLVAVPFSFSNVSAGNYSTDAAYGAAGWMVEGRDIPKAGVFTEIVSDETVEGLNDPEEATEHEDLPEDIYERSLFFDADADSHGENLGSAEEETEEMYDREDDGSEEVDEYKMHRGEDGLIDYSNWDE